MEIGFFRGIVTLALLLLFLGLCAYVFSRRRKAEYDAAAQMPLMDDERPAKNGEEPTR